ncbi:RICIN domain-containing protein [Streptomyces sp. NPDC001404]|uniref:RICIN domain-containing protein n=1 Tax=Streptomyces sp. NPDC001404 TaxID=3364571 RepID=UPI0036CB3870
MKDAALKGSMLPALQAVQRPPGNGLLHSACSPVFTDEPPDRITFGFDEKSFDELKSFYDRQVPLLEESNTDPTAAPKGFVSSLEELRTSPGSFYSPFEESIGHLNSVLGGPLGGVNFLMWAESVSAAFASDAPVITKLAILAQVDPEIGNVLGIIDGIVSDNPEEIATNTLFLTAIVASNFIPVVGEVVDVVGTVYLVVSLLIESIKELFHGDPYEHVATYRNARDDAWPEAVSRNLASYLSDSEQLFLRFQQTAIEGAAQTLAMIDFKGNQTLARLTSPDQRAAVRAAADDAKNSILASLDQLLLKSAQRFASATKESARKLVSEYSAKNFRDFTNSYMDGWRKKYRDHEHSACVSNCRNDSPGSRDCIEDCNQASTPLEQCGSAGNPCGRYDRQFFAMKDQMLNDTSPPLDFESVYFRALRIYYYGPGGTLPIPVLPMGLLPGQPQVPGLPRPLFSPKLVYSLGLFPRPHITSIEHNGYNSRKIKWSKPKEIPPQLWDTLKVYTNTDVLGLQQEWQARDGEAPTVRSGRDVPVQFGYNWTPLGLPAVFFADDAPPHSGRDDRIKINGTSGSAPLVGSTCTLTSALAANVGLVADVRSGSLDNGAVVQQYQWNGTDAQRWHVKDGGAGSYVLTNVKSGKYMDVKDGSLANRALIIQYQGTGADNQKWRLMDAGNDAFQLVSLQSGKALTAPEGLEGTPGGDLYQMDPQTGNKDLMRWYFSDPGGRHLTTMGTLVDTGIGWRAWMINGISTVFTDPGQDGTAIDGVQSITSRWPNMPEIYRNGMDVMAAFSVSGAWRAYLIKQDGSSGNYSVLIDPRGSGIPVSHNNSGAKYGSVPVRGRWPRLPEFFQDQEPIDAMGVIVTSSGWRAWLLKGSQVVAFDPGQDGTPIPFEGRDVTTIRARWKNIPSLFWNGVDSMSAFIYDNKWYAYMVKNEQSILFDPGQDGTPLGHPGNTKGAAPGIKNIDIRWPDLLL